MLITGILLIIGTPFLANLLKATFKLTWKTDNVAGLSIFLAIIGTPLIVWSVIICFTSLEVDGDTIRYRRISSQREISLSEVHRLSERIDVMTGGKYGGILYSAILLFCKRNGESLLEIARYPQMFRKGDYQRFLKALKEANPTILIDQDVIGRLDVEDAFSSTKPEPSDPRPFMNP